MTAHPQVSTRPEPQAAGPTAEQLYEYPETRELVALVDDAAELVRTKGEAAFDELRQSGSRWGHEETYVFVLDLEGNMLVHPDPALEGKNQILLEDVGGKPIIRGLIGAATTSPRKSWGFYQYQWPVPGGLFPRWKTSYVRLVEAPSGKSYVVGSGMYDDRMERAFVVDAVTNAVELIEQQGESAFSLLRDPKGPFVAKDTYVFVQGLDGVELVNPAFPNLEGRNVLDMTDTRGKPHVKEIIEVVETRGSGWIDYMWPKPGDSVSTQKSAYVKRARLGDKNVAVGCGVYLADAPRESRPAQKISALELMALVREAAALVEKQGVAAYAELRRKGSKWFFDNTYFFALDMEETIALHAADPAREGQKDSGVDVLNRPFHKMIMEAGSSASGEGWVHYMFPQPANVFPTWKSTFVKRLTLPSGRQQILCCGIYDMKMDETLIEDVVDRAATLIATHGREAFAQLRDKKGTFVFMDTYVFVLAPDGTELVNPAFPRLEGRNLMSLRDLTGRLVVKDEIDAALERGSAWLECHWFSPGDNKPAPKRTYVRKVEAGPDTFIVGCGIYR